MLQLHVPCILFGVQLRDSELATEIAGHLDFSPAVYTLANKIIGMMSSSYTYSCSLIPDPCHSCKDLSYIVCAGESGRTTAIYTIMPYSSTQQETLLQYPSS